MPDNTSTTITPITYPATPLWGGYLRVTSVPSHIYEYSPEPKDSVDAQAKIDQLRTDLKEIDRQLTPVVQHEILLRKYDGNQVAWESWKRSVESCRRVKKAQLFIYVQWLKKAQTHQQLEFAPITEGMRIAQRALGKAGALQSEVQLLKERVAALELQLSEILGINNG